MSGKATVAGATDLLDALTGRSSGLYPHEVYLMVMRQLPSSPDSATASAFVAEETAVGFPELVRWRVDNAVSTPTMSGSMVSCFFPAGSAVSTSPASVAPANTISAFALVSSGTVGSIPSKVWGYGVFDSTVTLTVGSRLQINVGGVVFVVG